MEKLDLKAKVREQKGKNAANRLRMKEEIPAILYGNKSDPVMLSISTKELMKLLNTKAGGNVLLNLKIEGKEDQTAMIREKQANPVSGALLHVDLFKVSLTEELIVKIPVKFTGEAPGVKLGGVLEFHLRQIEVKCSAVNIPESITVDISALNMGDSVHVRDLKVPEGVTITEDKDEPVLMISIPKVE
jgi:large subunit ribosomal protein L25